MLNWVKLRPFLPLKTQNKPSMTNFYRFKVVQTSSAIAENMFQPSPQKRHYDVKGSTNLCFALSQLSLFAAQRITHITQKSSGASVDSFAPTYDECLPCE